MELIAIAIIVAAAGLTMATRITRVVRGARKPVPPGSAGCAGSCTGCEPTGLERNAPCPDLPRRRRLHMW